MNLRPLPPQGSALPAAPHPDVLRPKHCTTGWGACQEISAIFSNYFFVLARGSREAELQISANMHAVHLQPSQKTPFALASAGGEVILIFPGDIGIQVGIEIPSILYFVRSHLFCAVLSGIRFCASAGAAGGIIPSGPFVFCETLREFAERPGRAHLPEGGGARSAPRVPFRASPFRQRWQTGRSRPQRPNKSR